MINIRKIKNEDKYKLKHDNRTYVIETKKEANKIKRHLIKGGDMSGYINGVINGRTNYPPEARKLISSYGNNKIKQITILRSPIQSVISTLMNAVSMGEFQKRLDKSPYDSLFHLFIVLTLDNGQRLLVEKNEVINISTKIPPYPDKDNIKMVQVQKDITLNTLLDNGEALGGDAYFKYNGYNKNCQDFITLLLKGSQIGDMNDYSFVKQDTKGLFKNQNFLRKIMNTTTEIGSRFDVLRNGHGI